MTNTHEAPLGMYAVAEDPNFPRVTIGDFTLCRQSEGRIWIQRSSGEGGEFNEGDLASAISAYYHDNF